MDIKKVAGRKKEYLGLLLLADEQESMVDRYLERGEMFVLDDRGVKAECVVTREADGIYELKNIAVQPDCRTMLVGTGDTPATLDFYAKCGFTESHRVTGFFTDNYDHPIYENGRMLVDMVYLKRER